MVRLFTLFAILTLSTVQISMATAQSPPDPHAPSVTLSQDPIQDESNSSTTTTITEIKSPTLSPFLIRLHLIRHGETEANVQNLVLGQGDSPLTKRGLEIARVAAASDDINGRNVKYWRTYCSDLYRAHRTARIVLGMDVVDDVDNGNEGGIDKNKHPVDSDVDLIVDARLRELAKGAREGFDKSLSYQEALVARQSYADENNGGEIQVPLLESIEDAWKRVQNWIDSLVDDASNDYYSDNAEECDADDGEENGTIHSKAPKVYDVFALSHSALIRTMIHQMVDSQLPPHYAKTREGSLRIPNLSRTIIDVRSFRDKNGIEGMGVWGVKNKWTASLVSLTDVAHLREQTSNLQGPPYL